MLTIDQVIGRIAAKQNQSEDNSVSFGTLKEFLSEGNTISLQDNKYWLRTSKPKDGKPPKHYITITANGVKLNFFFSKGLMGIYGLKNPPKNPWALFDNVLRANELPANDQYPEPAVFLTIGKDGKETTQWSLAEMLEMMGEKKATDKVGG